MRKLFDFFLLLFRDFLKNNPLVKFAIMLTKRKKKRKKRENKGYLFNP